MALRYSKEPGEGVERVVLAIERQCDVLDAGGIDRHLHTSKEGLDLCTRGTLTERDADRICVVTRDETKRRKTLISRGARDRYRYWWLRVAPNDIDRGIGVVAGRVIQKDRINLPGVEPASAGRSVAGVECNELPAIPIDLRHLLTPLFSECITPGSAHNAPYIRKTFKPRSPIITDLLNIYF